MSDAKRMHGLMIGQPNFAAAAKSKAQRGKGGRFVKADEAAAPKAVLTRLKEQEQ